MQILSNICFCGTFAKFPYVAKFMFRFIQYKCDAS